MDSLVYPRETALSRIALVIGVIFWLALLVGTVGTLLIYLVIVFIAYVFAHSAFIAYIKGTAARLSPEQYPDLHAQFERCCDKLGMSERPEAFLLHGDGMFNAFATRFLGRHFVILLSDVVDAMDKMPDGVNFYIGHELGHIRMKHLTGRLWRWPALWLPLLGAAHARAQESTCDRHGLACCEGPEQAARAMAALAAGSKRWATMNIAAYCGQTQETSGFWMSYHELTGSYPWLTKRIARIAGHESSLPARHSLAWILAFFTPNVGRASGALGPLIVVAAIGILAAVALPAYQDYTVRAKLTQIHFESERVAAAVGAAYTEKKEAPESLQAIGQRSVLPSGATVELDEDMALMVQSKHGGFTLTPEIGDDDKVTWLCSPDEKTRPAVLPLACR